MSRRATFAALAALAAALPCAALPLGLRLTAQAAASAKPVTARSYVQDGLVAMWDGIENAGWGLHDNNATNWVDLVGGANIVGRPYWTYIDYTDSTMAERRKVKCYDSIAKGRHYTSCVDTNGVFHEWWTDIRWGDRALVADFAGTTAKVYLPNGKAYEWSYCIQYADCYFGETLAETLASSDFTIEACVSRVRDAETELRNHNGWAGGISRGGLYNGLWISPSGWGSGSGKPFGIVGPDGKLLDASDRSPLVYDALANGSIATVAQVAVGTNLTQSVNAFAAGYSRTIPFTRALTRDSRKIADFMKVSGQSVRRQTHHCYRIYNRALTAAEIAHNAAIDRKRFGTSDDQ